MIARTLSKTTHVIDEIVQRVAFACLVVMIVATTLQIVFRVFFDALSWSEEVSRYMLVWSTFLGATLAYRRSMHISVTFVRESFSPGVRKTLRIFAAVSALVFFAVAFNFALDYMSRQWQQVSAALRLPMPVVYIVMPISLFVMILHSIDALVAEFSRPQEEEL
ncbi:MAG: TRAP transporter small permease subunit [Spirochaetes bacterium]|nr:TRAP transporter small permease subunit [Spirochaetota bacterium]